MTELRELTDAELDIVAGGITNKYSNQGGVIKLVETLIVDILRLLEHQKQMTRVLAD